MKASVHWFACCALALSASADTPQPPAEFWQYMLEFSDENGEVIDPLEFSELDKKPSEQVVEKKPQDPQPTPAEETLK